MTVLVTDLHPLPPAGGVTVLINQKTVQTNDTVSANTGGTSETNIASSVITLPANTLKAGESFTLEVGGGFTTSAAGPTQRPRIRIGSALIADAGDLTLLLGATNMSWAARCNFSVRSIGTAGTIEASTQLFFASSATATTTIMAGPNGGGTAGGNPVTLNTTIDNVFRLATQYASATAGNAVTMRTCTLIKRGAT